MEKEDIREIADYTVLPEKPVVSILMITYNHEMYVQQAVESILAQETTFSFELVIGEDCSTDGTRQLVVDFQKSNPRKVRIIYSEGNVGANRNFARTYVACRGDYIAICEGDDCWGDKSKLEKQIAFLVTHPDCVVTYHDAKVVDASGAVLRQSKLPAPFKRDFSSSELAMGTFLLTLTMCFRKKFDKFPEEFFRVINGDTFLTSMLSSFGYGHYHADISPGLYREHSSGVWSSLKDRDKRQQKLITYYWLSCYYSRRGDNETVRRLQLFMIEESVDAFGVSNWRVVTRFIKRMFS